MFLTTAPSLRPFYTLACYGTCPFSGQPPPSGFGMPALYSYLTICCFRTFQWYPPLTAQYKVQTRRFKALLGSLLILSCLPCLCCLQSPPDRTHPAGRVASIHLCSLTSSRMPGADQASNSAGEEKVCSLRMCLRAPSSLLPQYPPLLPDLV